MDTLNTLPVQVESAAVGVDAADELEWVQLESTDITIQGCRMHAPDGFTRRGSPYWLGPKSTGPRVHPKGYRLKGEASFGAFPGRAASPDMAQRHFDLYPAVRFTPAQYGPYYHGEPAHMRYASLRTMTYHERAGVWK